MAEYTDDTEAAMWSQEQTWTMNGDQSVQPGSLMISNEELLDLSFGDMNLIQNNGVDALAYPVQQSASMSAGTSYMDNAPSFSISQEESDCSWTEADSQDLWYEHLQQQLEEYRKGSGCTLTTIALGSRQRKQVHSMANMVGLSHMSIGSGRHKRVLLSKCALAKTGDSKDRRWNPARESWYSGYIDPRLVLLHWVSAGICFKTCLNVLGLPTPINMTRDIRGDHCTVYALFETPEEASATILALNETRPHWNLSAIDRNIETCYLRLPRGFSLTSHLLTEGFCKLPVLVYQGFSGTQSRNPNHTLSGSCSPPSCSSLPRKASLTTGGASPTELANALFRISSSPRQHPPVSASALHSRRGSFSRRMSMSSSLSRDLGYISASSQVDSDYSLATNTSKKRRREPKILAGYRCPFQGCDKSFDHQGELTKHEKVHSADRSHFCTQCGKGFYYPKDLRRHERVHATESTPVSPILEPAGSCSDVESYELRTPARHICTCCPTEPKTFNSELELQLHESEKPLRCEQCLGRFKTKAELARHQNATHSEVLYSCGSLSDIEAVYIARSNGIDKDACAYCGEGFPRPPDWGIRCQHLIKAHQFGSCNKSKKFYRVDHFRQHLRLFHHSTQGTWLRRLEDAGTSTKSPKPSQHVSRS